MKITDVMDNVQNKVNEVGAKAMLAAVNATGKAMNTRLGRAALVVPMAVSVCTLCRSDYGSAWSRCNCTWIAGCRCRRYSDRRRLQGR